MKGNCNHALLFAMSLLLISAVCFVGINSCGPESSENDKATTDDDYADDDGPDYITDVPGGIPCSENPELDPDDTDFNVPDLPTEDKMESICDDCEFYSDEEPTNCESVVIRDGKMWTKCSSSTYSCWNCAMCSVHKLNLCGYHDWRLPTLNELLSLCDSTNRQSYWDDSDAAWNNVGIVSPFDLYLDSLWTLTEDEDDDDRSYSISFSISGVDYCRTFRLDKDREDTGGFLAIRP